MTGRILVAGDVHLGSSNANAEAFDAFLDEVYRDRDEVSALVLLGDLWDLVRRDPFGCAWETAGTIGRLQRLADELPVRLLLGNHDACLGTLRSSRYDVEFVDECVLHQAGYDIRFCHGHAFDGFQFDLVSNYLSGPGDRGEIDPTRGRKDPIVAWVRERVRRGTAGLRGAWGAVVPGGDGDGAPSPRRERRAHAYLETISEDKLVYGHTHAPYVHPDNVAANPGSWKATAPLHDTYLAIEDGRIELYRYRRGGADERME